MKWLRFFASAFLCLYSGITLIAIARNEFVYSPELGLVACLVILFYSWEDIWR